MGRQRRMDRCHRQDKARARCRPAARCPALPAGVPRDARHASARAGHSGQIMSRPRGTTKNKGLGFPHSRRLSQSMLRCCCRCPSDHSRTEPRGSVVNRCQSKACSASATGRSKGGATGEVYRRETQQHVQTAHPRSLRFYFYARERKRHCLARI